MRVEKRPRTEPLGDHYYLAHFSDSDDIVDIRLHASRIVLERLAVTSADEARGVKATAAHLVQRQRANDLPTSLDLDDVAAAYGDYIDEIHRRLAQLVKNSTVVPKARSHGGFTGRGDAMPGRRSTQAGPASTRQPTDRNRAALHHKNRNSSAG